MSELSDLMKGVKTKEDIRKVWSSDTFYKAGGIEGEWASLILGAQYNRLSTEELETRLRVVEKRLGISLEGGNI